MRALVWLTLVALLVLVNVIAAVPSGEGLNPSDDGVILAQSHRLLSGEMPHRDFISIRPAGSALLHSLHLLLPFPMELSARWFVLLQYFIYSLFFVLAMRQRSESTESKSLLWVPFLTLLAFLYNQNHYNLFPWTTIDALFWLSAGIYLMQGINRVSYTRHRLFLTTALMVFSFSMSVLSRQTFALPVMVLVFFWLSQVIKQGVFVRILAPAMVGSLPILVYAGVLTMGGAWGDFFQQMTGRTEVWETGFVAFWNHFWGAPVAYLLILAVLSFFSDQEGKRFHLIWHKMAPVLMTMLATWLVVLLAAVFIWPQYLFRISFELFYLLVFLMVLFRLVGKGQNRELINAGWIILLVAWTSSVSLGDNAPVFCTGVLAAANVEGVRRLWLQYYPGVTVKPAILTWLMMPLAAVLIAASVYTQKQNNYRDLPAHELTGDAGDLFGELRGIRLNEELYAYFSEVRQIWEDYGSPRQGFVILPNNAILYPVMKLENPLPLDWLQRDEFIGNEDRLLEEFEKVMREQNLVILLERYNVKWLATERLEYDESSPQYPWLPLLFHYAEEKPGDRVFFRVFETAQKKSAR